MASIRANKCRLVMLPSPNNPTGTLLPNADIRTLCAEDALIVVDEVSLNTDEFFSHEIGSPLGWIEPENAQYPKST